MIYQLSGLKFIKALTLQILFAIVLVAATGLPVHAEKNPFIDGLPPASVSHADSAFGPMINPAFADIAPSPSISYLFQSYKNSGSGNHLFLADLSGFLFSYSRFNNTLIPESGNTNLFTLGKGFFFGNIFGFGLNYSFAKGGNNYYNSYRSISSGLLLRPASFLSLGYAGRDMNDPRINGIKIPRTDIYSLSVRPLNFITVSADCLKYEYMNFDFSDMFYSLSLRFKYNISVFAGISGKKDFRFGVSIPIGILGKSTITTEAFTDFNKSFSLGSYGFGISIAGQKTRSFFEQERYLKIILDGSLKELKTQSLFKSSEPTFYDLLSAINKAAGDPTVKGIILQIENTDIGFSQIQELRDQIKILRRNKKVYSILCEAGNKEYYLASACDKIYYAPLNVFTITGLSAEVYFFRQGLEKLGIKYESVKRGIYKSFDEEFTREHISPEYKENLTAYIKDLNDQFLGDIKEDRKISEEKMDAVLEKGLLAPEEALSSGFIDSIEYPEDAVNSIIAENGKKQMDIVYLTDYIAEKITNYQWGPIPEIAIVYVTGSIVRGQTSGYDGINPGVIGDSTYKKALYDAFTDPAIKAIIIRIDSGGGSAAASELMWHYLSSLKHEYNKPVIFSFGNMAASGGYYIALTGDKILSDKASLTGSIGVVAGKLSLKELYKKLGINKDIIKMSEFADIFTESRDFTPEERNKIQEGVDFVYDRFTQRVSEARKIPQDLIDKKAEGRIFTGRQAKDNGLVDEFGGLLAAIEIARNEAAIKHQYSVKLLPESDMIFNLLDYMSLGKVSENIKSFIRRLEIADFNNENTLYYFPYRLVIK